MARKILLKEDGINGLGSSPNGYKYIGYDGSIPSQKSGATISEIGGSSYTETIINISSAEILSMGTSPIQLLPAPGVGKYYEIEKIVLEYTYVTTPYSCSDLINARHSSNYSYTAICSGAQLLQKTENAVSILYFSEANVDISNGFAFCGVQILNESIILDTYNNTNPTLGDGTLRAKIYYKTITFGS